MNIWVSNLNYIVKHSTHSILPKFNIFEKNSRLNFTIFKGLKYAQLKMGGGERRKEK